MFMQYNSDLLLAHALVECLREGAQQNKNIFLKSNQSCFSTHNKCNDITFQNLSGIFHHIQNIFCRVVESSLAMTFNNNIIVLFKKDIVILSPCQNGCLGPLLISKRFFLLRCTVKYLCCYFLMVQESRIKLLTLYYQQ